MKKPILILALIVFLTSAACAIPVETRWSVQPTQAPTSTPDPADALITPPPGSTLVPTVDPNAQAGNMPAGVTNIMVLGSDFRAGGGARTDVIMLVSINTTKQTVSVVSFPRDLYVPIPGWTTQRINTAFGHGGFPALADTMESNFGVRPSYYLMTDFNGFKSIIDRLGGVDIYAGDRLVDRCDLPIAVDGMCTIEPGRYHMDSETALWYIRSRHTSSDLDRLRREQEVMTGMFIGLMSANAVANAPGLYESFKGAVQTDLPLEAIVPLLPTAATVFGDRERIHRFALTVNEAKPFVTESGAQVLLPDYDLINQIMNEAIFQQ